MEIPTPPTDNLYKFMAISGLLSLAACLYFPLTYQIKLYDEVINDKQTAALTLEDTKYLRDKMDFLQEIVTNSILSKQGKYIEPTNAITLHYSDSEIKQIYSDIYDFRHQIAISIAKMDTDNDRYEEHRYYYDKMKWFVDGLIFYSFVITLSGFILWYHRIQRHIDKEVRKTHKPK